MERHKCNKMENLRNTNSIFWKVCPSAEKSLSETISSKTRTFQCGKILSKHLGK